MSFDGSEATEDFAWPAIDDVSTLGRHLLSTWNRILPLRFSPVANSPSQTFTYYPRE